MSVNNHVEAKIASGESLSNILEFNDQRLVGIYMPASWTTANLTFQACDTAAGTFLDVYDAAGVELVVTAAASRHIVIPADAFRGVRYLKIRSGTTAAAVTQGGARTLRVAVDGDF